MSLKKLLLSHENIKEKDPTKSLFKQFCRIFFPPCLLYLVNPRVTTNTSICLSKIKIRYIHSSPRYLAKLRDDRLFHKLSCVLPQAGWKRTLYFPLPISPADLPVWPSWWWERVRRLVSTSATCGQKEKQCPQSSNPLVIRKTGDKEMQQRELHENKK